jgi:hypothetical protein
MNQAFGQLRPPDSASVAPVAWLTPPTHAMNEFVTFCRDPETVCGMLANSPCNDPTGSLMPEQPYQS